MDLRKLEYIVAIAEEQSITKAAERVFITRPALDHFLLNLEADLHVQLFNRINRKLYPTYAGELYIKAAKEILGIKKQTYKLIEEISNNTIGQIRIGVTHGVGNIILADVLPKFHEKYPNFNIELKEANIRELEQMVSDGTIDFTVEGNGSVPSQLEHITTIACEVVLVLPKSHPLAKEATNNSAPHPSIDLKLLENERFILMNKNTNIRAIADRHFDMAGFEPKTLIECSMSTLAYQFVKSGLGPSILMEYQVNPADDVAVFSLNPKETWFQSVAFRRGTVFSQAERYFIDLILKFFSEVKPEWMFPINRVERNHTSIS